MLRTLRLVIVPSEHGSWGFLLFPVLIGLSIAPSAAGTHLSLAAVCAFLCRQPLRIALTDLYRRRKYPRTRVALMAASPLLLLALVSGAFAYKPAILMPLAVAMGLGGLSFTLDLAGKHRTLLGELSGAVAVGLLIPMILLLSQTPARVWILITAIWCFHVVTSIVYVRERLHDRRVTVLVCFLPVIAAWWYAPLPVAVVLVVLAARAIYGLLFGKRDIRAAQVGMQEMSYSLLLAAVLIANR